MEKAPQITLILPYFNEAGWIGKTLECLAGQDDRRFRLILVDNGSTDAGKTEAISVCAKMTDIEISHETVTTPGKIFALAHGCALADTPWLATIDADTNYPKEYVGRILRLVAENPDAAAVMAIDLHSDDAAKNCKRIRKIMRKARVFPGKCHAGGYAQAFSTAAYRQAGGFSAEIWPYVLEDHEIVARIGRYGRIVSSPAHICYPSDRRNDRSDVDWSRAERLTYKLTPAALLPAYFRLFLGPRLRKRRSVSASLRRKVWDNSTQR